jgi:hypothetical protein
MGLSGTELRLVRVIGRLCRIVNDSWIASLASAELSTGVETARGPQFWTENRLANWKAACRFVTLGDCCCSERIYYRLE